MSDRPAPPPLWTRGPDGVYRASLNGRAWTLREPTGTTAWALYSALQVRLGALGLYAPGATRATMSSLLLRMGVDAEVQRLARQTVDWMTCDGVDVAGAFDRAFPARRVAEVPYLAQEAWSVLGFFVAPGALPPPPETEPTTTPEHVDAV